LKTALRYPFTSGISFMVIVDDESEEKSEDEEELVILGAVA
jgi:hypothetical protein